jgi:cytochrome c2
MPVIVKVLGFSLALTLVFTLIANLLPQIEGEAPVEKTLELGAFTEETFVVLGEELFKGKGTCTLCHNSMGRAPDILVMNMVETAAERLGDARYQGEATDAESYLRESMLQPSLYVVKNYGKKGSNDTVSPMPIINKAPIQLSDIEIDAVIAYMQAKDGNLVTVALPVATPEKTVKAEVEAEKTAYAVAQSADEAIERFGCTTCHAILESEASIGPNLRDVDARLNESEIRQSIVDPNAVIAEGYSAMMPGHYAEQMRFKELDMIVQFLANQRKEAFVSLGEEIFKGKGACTRCHNSMEHAPAPNISAVNLVETAIERLADPRYQGEATDAESYLRESMLQPEHYVVEGYGKQGTHDTESVMPTINQAPFHLSDIEIDAMIAYMQAKDGNPVTVPLPSLSVTAATPPSAATTPIMAAKDAENIIKQSGCIACHSILDSESPIGPDLRNVGTRLSATEIRQSIVDPNAVIAEGYFPMMPANFAEQLKSKELDMIVQFLAEQKGKGAQ